MSVGAVTEADSIVSAAAEGVAGREVGAAGAAFRTIHSSSSSLKVYSLILWDVHMLLPVSVYLSPSQRMALFAYRFCAECWFCLSSAHVQEHEKHLIVSIGNSSYIALAKGPLAPDHVIVIPIEHISSAVDAPDSILLECAKYKAALRSFFASRRLEVVIFERTMVGVRAPQHVLFQVVPVPPQVAQRLYGAFKEAAPFEDVPPGRDPYSMAGVHGHLIVELPGGQTLIAAGRMPANLARSVNFPHSSILV